MIDFIDKTTEQNGTPINRQNLMAVQGFESVTTTFSYVNGVLNAIETNSANQTKTTTFNADNSVTEKFVGDKTITKTTKVVNGKITEVIS